MRIITSSCKKPMHTPIYPAVSTFQSVHMMVYHLSQQFYAQNCLAHVWNCSIHVIIDKS